MRVESFSGQVGGLALGAAVVLGLSFGGVSARSSKEGALARHASAAAAASQGARQASPIAPGGPHEAIKVHGHWIIEVRNPDGTLVTRREFRNELTQDGRDRLVRVLSHQAQLGLWGIRLGGNPCLGTAKTRVPCDIVEESTPLTFPNVFKPLTVIVPGEGPNSGKLVLGGTARAHVDAEISGVSTLMLSCRTTDDCIYPMFTERLFPPFEGIRVAAGQSIDVTVVISFS